MGNRALALYQVEVGRRLDVGIVMPTKDKARKVQTTREWRHRNPERCKQFARDYREKNRDVILQKKNEWYQQNKLLARIYRREKIGWFGDDFLEALYEQQGRCAICGFLFRAEHECAADHNHTTGKRRAVLCRKCNLWLGMFETNRELWSTKFPAYLEKWNAS